MEAPQAPLWILSLLYSHSHLSKLSKLLKLNDPRPELQLSESGHLSALLQWSRGGSRGGGAERVWRRWRDAHVVFNGGEQGWAAVQGCGGDNGGLEEVAGDMQSWGRGGVLFFHGDWAAYWCEACLSCHLRPLSWLPWPPCWVPTSGPQACSQCQVCGFVLQFLVFLFLDLWDFAMLVRWNFLFLNLVWRMMSKWKKKRWSFHAFS